MRTKLVAGNWKMNPNWDEAMTLMTEVSKAAQDGVQVAIFPPAVYVRHFFEYFKHTRSKVILGAQDCSAQLNGAFTGETSASMLASVGVSHVLIGHSERRHFHHESNALLLEKIYRAFDAGLIPVYCCGERLEERESGQHLEVVRKQLAEVLFLLEAERLQQVIIAYEPVWAIGTGRNATPEQAQEMHKAIRLSISNHAGESIANQIRILYGGSVKADNAAALFTQPDVDGALVGGASLKAEEFLKICGAAAEL